MDPRRRFSNRVEYYIKYRPHYPRDVVGLMTDRMGLTPDAVIADVGSGTGISSRLFLENGNRVYGVEPNREMREAAEAELWQFPRFLSAAGSAEETGLADHSVDFIVAAQAFHWFDRRAAGREAARVLKPGGWAVLIWNERRTKGSPFLHAFEDLLLRFAPDYPKVDHTRLGRGELREFYSHDQFLEARFDNRQVFDFEGLTGRVYSTSYSPLPGSPGHDEMLSALRELYERFQAEGLVAFEYDTRVYFGRMVP